MTIRILRFPLAVLLVAAAACTSSPSTKAEQHPAGYKYNQPASKTNSSVVEETDTYYVTRYEKSKMVRVDDTHFKLPFMNVPTKIYKEDDKYFYVRTEKYTPEEIEARKKAQEKAKQEREGARGERVRESIAQKSGIPETFKAIPPVTLADFEPIVPARARAGVLFEKAGAGLPQGGQWRQNIAVADFNGDGIPDIVSSPARMSIHGGPVVFLGDGHGGFAEHKYQFVDSKGETRSAGGGYGGAVIADFDGDGLPDIAMAWHQGMVRVYLQRPGDRLEVVTAGLPGSFSAQAIAALDVNGDGLPDLVVSGDDTDPQSKGPDKHQVRVFVNGGKAGWRYEPGALEGGCFSNRVFAIDLSGSGKPADILTACKFFGGWGLTWKNDGKGKYSGEVFPLVEQSAYHIAVAPGTFGADRAVAYADLFIKQVDKLNVSGLNVYYKRAGQWSKVAVWRQREFPGRLMSVAMGDLDGDGLDDLVFPDNAVHKVRIFFQTAAGGFVESPEALEPPLDSPAADVRLADLDRDGKLDIILAKSVYSENKNDPGGIDVFLNRGSQK